MSRKKSKPSEKKGRDNYVIEGMVLIGIALIALWQKSFEGFILFFCFGIGYLAYNSNQRQDELWRFMFGGFKRIMSRLFGNIFKENED